ncbi:putative Structural protein [Tenacibaculum amylolyticum]
MKSIFQFLKNFLIVLFLIVLIILFSTLSMEKVKAFFNGFLGNGVDYQPLQDTGAVISDYQARVIAEGLYSAMYKVGTDEDRIYSLLSGVNQGDFAKIYNAFGSRYYLEYTGTWADSVLGVKIDLIGWLENELTESELKHLSNITKGVF